MGRITGRYAPSPTGDLHLGNLRSALLAWLHARLQGGRFIVRMEDLDTPRVVSGSAAQILRDLEWLGLDWDGPVVYQSQRHGLYHDAMAKLEVQNLVYPCFCSRKELREIASAPHANTSDTANNRYPGTCSDLSAKKVAMQRETKDPAMRVKVGDTEISFEDAVLGSFSQSLSAKIGDFVVKRADGLFAYQLAVVVDDIEQNISHVVRGADLIDSTPRQLYLLQCLQPNHLPFNYWHLPLVKDKNGKRLAKRDGADSASAWRDQGFSAEQMIGLFATELNLLNKAELTARDLQSELSIEALRLALISKSHSENFQSP